MKKKEKKEKRTIIFEFEFRDGNFSGSAFLAKHFGTVTAVGSSGEDAQ